MTAVIGVLALGSIGFYILLSLLTVILWACLENDKPGFATISVVAALAVMGWFGDFNILAYAKQSPLHFVEVVVAQVLLGFVWAVIKWWFHVKAKARKYTEMLHDFLESLNLPLNTVMTDDLKKRFYDLNYGAKQLSKRPRMKDNKARILTWMIYWEWSFVWTMINDPVVRLFKEILARTSKLFDHISKRAFAGIDE